MRKLILLVVSVLAAVPAVGFCDDEEGSEDTYQWYAEQLEKQQLEWKMEERALEQQIFQSQLLDDLDSIRRDLDEVTPQ